MSASPGPSRHRHALLAGMLLAATALPAAAEELGRLFMTPERRAQLDRQRQLNIREIQVVTGSTLSLDGIVRRSGGPATIWINGVPQLQGGRSAGVDAMPSGSSPDRATVAAGEDAPATLRVGERLHRTTRERDDGLQGGTVRVESDARRGR